MNRLYPGEFMVVGFEGNTVTPTLRKYILKWRVGGVILFGRNISGLPRTAELCRALRELRREVSDLPLLIAVDQEGGAVARFRDGVTLFPGNMALGVAGGEKDAYRQGRITGEELRKAGVNMNLAPVLDLYSLPGNPATGIRSLGSGPERVALLGGALIRGMQEEGIIATAKHFPGKGKAGTDSHLGLPVITSSARELESQDLIPFQASIASGVKAIMTSHAVYPAFNEKSRLPATLSPGIITGRLREALGFKNLIITDDLGMGAIQNYSSTPQAALGALKAGADMILLCHSPPERERVFAALGEEAAKDRRLGRRLEENLERIKRVKSTLSPFSRTASFPEKDRQGLSRRIARRAIRVLRDEKRLLPFRKGEKTWLVWMRPERTVEVEDQFKRGWELGSYLSQDGLPTESLRLPIDPSSEEIKACLQKARRAKQLVVTSYDGYRYRSQIDLIDGLLKDHPDAVLAVLRDPRDGNLFPRAGTVVASFGFSPPSLRALAGVISGRIKAKKETVDLAGIGSNYTLLEKGFELGITKSNSN